MSTGAKRFLYLSPTFPPVQAVGALRPLKMVRHLPAHGWTPVVMADVRARRTHDGRTLRSLPPGLDVTWTEKEPRLGLLAAARAEARAASVPWDGRLTSSPPTLLDPSFVPRHRLVQAGRWLMRRAGLASELGQTTRWVQGASRRLGELPDCRAIVVNAGPFRGCRAGIDLGARFGLPVILDLRDPAARCPLKRSKHSVLANRERDREERAVVSAAAAVVLNTETALRDYREAYAELPADRFTCIRNGTDRELVGGGAAFDPDPFTVLYLGSMRSILDGLPLLEGLALLRARGVGPDTLQLVVSSVRSGATLAAIDRLGLRDQVLFHPPLPPAELGGLMASADLHVLVGHATPQRIPAKTYEYLGSCRPILAMVDNPELAALLDAAGDADVVPLHDAAAAADVLARELDRGRRTVEHDWRPHASDRRAADLAALLDRVTAG
jgi:glycosyltransferase involved in cell wall biosynthesis